MVIVRFTATAIGLHRVMRENSLLPQFETLLRYGKIQQYLDELDQHGLHWIAEFKPFMLFAHLGAISDSLENLETSTRFDFFKYLCSGKTSPQRLKIIYLEFVEEKDYEAAALCIGAAFNLIWESGTNFQRFKEWNELTKILQQNGHLSAQASCFMLLQNCWAEVAGTGDIKRVFGQLTPLQRLAEKADSPDLILMSTALAAYIHFWRGDLAAFEILLRDAEPYLNSHEVAPIAALQFRISLGLFLTLQHQFEESENIFNDILLYPFLDALPPAVWLMLHSHYLYCLVSSGNLSGIEKIAAKIRQRVIPNANHYYHAYLHFNLGIAALALKRPHKALLHCQESAQRGKLCRSANCERMAALLYGQALADLGRGDEAAEHFQNWLPKWLKADYVLIASLAHLELARIFTTQQKKQLFVANLEQARDILPEKHIQPILYRSKGFFKEITEPDKLHCLFQNGSKPLHIKTLGHFSVLWKGDSLENAALKGTQSRLLLQLLITFGGSNVPVTAIADILWPEADGDRAMNSLKVALSRLRKSFKEYIDPQWLYVKRQRISLSSEFCEVDCFLFEKEMRNHVQQGSNNLQSLKAILDMYSGNYLETETTNSYILQKKEQLRNLYIKGVICYRHLCAEIDDYQEMENMLNRALQYDPANEVLYQLLMETCINQGRKVKALEYFSLAQKTLEDQYGMQPGRQLMTLAGKVTDKN